MKASPKRAAKSVADLTRGVIVAVVEIECPPERVFTALTDPKEIVQWWGAPDMYQVTVSEMDLRPGGAWRSSGKGADGHSFSVGGEIVEIEPPRRLVQTWKADWDGGNVTTIRYQLDPIPSGTRVTVRHEGFADRHESCASHGSGWERVLGWLSGHVAPAPEPKWFLCRLLAPRPTFVQDMTDDERAVMGAHAAYWKQKLDDGTAIVFGPVADPKGPWGVGIVRVPDEAAVRALEAGDPAIQSGRGFRYEILPMLRAVTRS
jgi:uncharacterized protein YndB with AHSA1/START domain